MSGNDSCTDGPAWELSFSLEGKKRKQARMPERSAGPGCKKSQMSFSVLEIGGQNRGCHFSKLYRRWWQGVRAETGAVRTPGSS